MDTPIYDFVKRYAQSNSLRAHMPGHKGVSFLGCEQLDITEIDGADVLYNAKGIIAKSEQNASKLFNTHLTVYSTEGSSLAIRAMLYLAKCQSIRNGKTPFILAGRNAHKVFLTASALLDLKVEWLYPENDESIISCVITPSQLERALESLDEKPTALYITSPDYLGVTSDIEGLARVCHENGMLLLVDNAHGAYLSFLEESRHPIALGADICCDSAHKTLPVLTGGAYLHVSNSASDISFKQAQNAMALFASTSPSYIIMQSLDLVNKYISDGYPKRLKAFIAKLDLLRGRLAGHGYSFVDGEPMKLTIKAKDYGYYGYELAEIISESGIAVEFSDPDYLTLMLTPENSDEDLVRLESALAGIPKKDRITKMPPRIAKPIAKMSAREAIFADSIIKKASECEGEILAQASVGCPPAIPIVMCGEIITREAIELFEYYDIEECEVVRQQI